ncbi:aldo/keto reductase [Opitutales bacterium]|nr:aldo/keto reductase [Opitutales bacterium]
MSEYTKRSQTFTIGGESTVNRMGFGAMRLTGQPGNFGPYAEWEEGKALLRRAVELGIQFFDSAYAYGPEWADKLIGDALHPYPEGIFVATKGGVDKPAPGQIVVDGSPKTLLTQVETALRNLKTDCIDLFQLHRVDPKVPLEESVGALDLARGEGKIRFIGLSNVNPDELDKALSVASIASVQNRYNQAERDDDVMVDYTNEKGIAYLPWGPLGAQPMESEATLPARESLAWLLGRSSNIIVIPGTTSTSHLEENVSAGDVV